MNRSMFSPDVTETNGSSDLHRKHLCRSSPILPEDVLNIPTMMQRAALWFKTEDEALCLRMSVSSMTSPVGLC